MTSAENLTKTCERGGILMSKKPLCMDKIKLVLSRMDDDYWEEVTNHCTAFRKRLEQLMGDFRTTYTHLSVVSISILEAKYTGYQRIVECGDEAEKSAIVMENKEQISILVQDKHQIVATFATLLEQLKTVIDDTEIIGEAMLSSKPKAGNSK